MKCPVCQLLVKGVGEAAAHIHRSHLQWTDRLVHRMKTGGIRDLYDAAYSKKCWCGVEPYNAHDFALHLKECGGVHVHYNDCMMGVHGNG